MPPRPVQQAPRKLSKQQHTYFFLGVPIGLIAVSVATAGLLVLSDAERKTALAQTQFADLWLRTIRQNPFVQALMFNFGLIGLGYSLSRLLEHRRALKLEREAAQQQQQETTDSRKDR